MLNCRRYMAEILPIWRKTLSNQSIYFKLMTSYRSILKQILKNLSVKRLLLLSSVEYYFFFLI